MKPIAKIRAVPAAAQPEGPLPTPGRTELRRWKRKRAAWRQQEELAALRRGPKCESAAAPH